MIGVSIRVLPDNCSVHLVIVGFTYVKIGDQNLFLTQRWLLWATGSTGQSNFANKLSFKCFSSAEPVQINFFFSASKQDKFVVSSPLFSFWWIYSFLSLASQQLEVADSKGSSFVKASAKAVELQPSLNADKKMDSCSL